jgi:transposase
VQSNAKNRRTKGKRKENVISATGARYIASALKYFRWEMKQGRGVDVRNPYARVASCLQVGETTVKKVYRMSNKGENFSKFNDERPERVRNMIVPDGWQDVIREVMRDLYRTDKKAHPSLDDLLVLLTNPPKCGPVTRSSVDLQWQWSRSTLHQYLLRVNFYSKERRDYYAGIREKPSIRLQRARYIRQVREFRAAGREIVYMDETWINERMTEERYWIWDGIIGYDDAGKPIMDPEGPIEPPPQKNRGVGSRSIVIGAGSAIRGIFPECLEIFKGKKEKRKDKDYHSDMNTGVFLDWCEKKLFPIMRGGVLVVDQAPYHTSKVKETLKPRSSWRRQEVIDYLNKHDIAFNPKLTVPELRELAKDKGPPEKFAVVELGRQFDVDVIFLPVAHPILNPIEAVWGVAKNVLRRHNAEESLNVLEQRLEEGMYRFSPRFWRGLEKHKTHPAEEEFLKSDENDTFASEDEAENDEMELQDEESEFEDD